MGDPFAATHQDLYDLIGSMSHSDWTGVFSRPAMLAAGIEKRVDIPVRALNRACLMLLDTDGMSVNELAENCGFENTLEFASFFRKATGWEPAEWRKRFGRRKNRKESK